MFFYGLIEKFQTCQGTGFPTDSRFNNIPDLRPRIATNCKTPDASNLFAAEERAGQSEKSDRSEPEEGRAEKTQRQTRRDGGESRAQEEEGRKERRRGNGEMPRVTGKVARRTFAGQTRKETGSFSFTKFSVLYNPIFGSDGKKKNRYRQTKH